MSEIDTVALQKDVAKLRRDQPANPVTQRVCDAVDAMLAYRPMIAKDIKPADIPQLKPDKWEILPQCPACETRKKQTRDRVANMRKRRAEVKT